MLHITMDMIAVQRANERFAIQYFQSAIGRKNRYPLLLIALC
jgi:hypothetical protein